MIELDDIKKNIDKDYEAARESSEIATEDFRFIGVSGGMWEDINWSGDDRVKLELDITSPHVMRYIGERNKNRAAPVFTPDDLNTNEDDADLMNGVYRGDFHNNDGKISTDNAIQEVAVCGMGAFRLASRFVDEEDPENEDQEIIFLPQTNAHRTVFFDETATRADKSDAKRCTVLTAHSPDAFEDKYPDKSPTSALTPESFNNYSNNGLRWHTRDVIYIAEYYDIRETKQPIQVWRHVENELVKGFPEDEIEEVKPELLADGWEFVRKRKLKRNVVWKTVVSGTEILEKEKKIAGKYLPIIPMYGFRFYIENQEFFKGLVRNLKDANRMLNTGASRMTEDSGASGASLPILTKSQFKSPDVQASWSNKAEGSVVLIDDQHDANGNPLPNNGVPFVPPTQVDPNTMGMVEVAGNFVQRETGNAPQDQVDPDASGKAIDALKDREDLTTQPVTDNIHVSLVHGAKVYESMAGDLYTRAQMKRVISKEGKTRIEVVNQASLDPETGNSITLNDLSKGKFSVDIEIGPQYESQKAATIGSLERIINVIGENHALQKPLIGAWVDNIEGTGLDGVKEQNRKMMLLEGSAKPETPEEEQMVQQAMNQPDKQDVLNDAIANQQNSEAGKLDAAAEKDRATSIKTRAETAKIVTDIGIAKSEEAFNQFERQTKRFTYNPKTGGLDSAGNRTS